MQEYLTFVLGTEHYALDIHRVQEIKGYQPPTPIANAPAYIKGVINLRGEIIPIVDLRIKFAVSEAIYNEFTIVIILHIEDHFIGVVVDEVSDVINITNEQVQPAPEFGVAFDHQYLQGLTEINEEMIIIVNIDKLMTSQDIGIFEQESATAKELL
jgi:purine-binding chemotaxis protein CheW